MRRDPFSVLPILPRLGRAGPDNVPPPPRALLLSPRLRRPLSAAKPMARKRLRRYNAPAPPARYPALPVRLITSYASPMNRRRLIALLAVLVVGAIANVALR